MLEENARTRDEKVEHLQQVESETEELKKEIAWITEQVRTIGYTDEQIRSIAKNETVRHMPCVI